jgi:hypothetical protein
MLLKYEYVILETNHIPDSFDLLIYERVPLTFNYFPFIIFKSCSDSDILSLDDVEVQVDELFPIDYLLKQRGVECMGNLVDTFDGDTYSPYCLNNEEDPLHVFHVLSFAKPKVCLELNTLRSNDNGFENKELSPI